MRMLPAYWGFAQEIPNIDFETYSEAGYIVDRVAGTVRLVRKNRQGGSIGIVGTAVYAEHPSTKLRSLSYNLLDGFGTRIWLPGHTPPADLFNYLASMKPVSAHHSYFEYKIWKEVCNKKMGWPAVPLEQFKDTARKVRAFSIPGSLAAAGASLNCGIQKQPGGKALINRFSIPQKRLKRRTEMEIDPQFDKKGTQFFLYNMQDVDAETAVNEVLPELIPFEEEVFQLDQKINDRGICVDLRSVEYFIKIVEHVTELYTAELRRITSGYIQTHNEQKKMIEWLRDRGYYFNDLQANTIEAEFDTIPDGPEKRVLEIRKLLGSAAVAKLYALRYRTSEDNRIREVFTYCGADRTGRWNSRGIQFHNQKSEGPNLIHCENGCNGWYGTQLDKCPHCGTASFLNPEPKRWRHDAVEFVIGLLPHVSSAYFLEIFPDPVFTIAGCIRGLFIAPEGKDILCSDFKSIEAVVMAELAQEPWRQEVFRTHGKIYEMTASKITGVPFEEICNYPLEHDGADHPLRKKVGKVSELSGQFGSWIGGWKRGGAGKYFKTDEEIKQAILKWRKDSPKVVKFWKEMEGCFVNAVLHPGYEYAYNGIAFQMIQDKLFVKLPSGRRLTYHSPEVTPYVDDYGRDKWRITQLEWNTNAKRDPRTNQWVRFEIWYGLIVENIIQAVARDLLAYSIIQLERHGYPVIFHTHDEPGAEVPAGWGSVEEFERIGSMVPPWALGWPVKLTGGWRGKRYRKG